MVYEELVGSMEEAAQQKNREILQRANQEADGIIRDAEKSAEEVRNGYMKEGRRLAEVERNRLTYLTGEEVKSVISKEKEQLFYQAFLMAGENLKNIRSSPGYRDLYERLILEAIREMQGKDYTLHIDSRDKQLCQEIITQKQIPALIKTDLECAGGLNISSSDERITVFNTLESRLEKAKNIHKLEIHTELTGE